ncbi:MAG: GNAT family N-acetyltransferase [Cyanobacteria bacterium J06597_16]
MITFSRQHNIDIEQVLQLYQANGWSSAEKPQALHRALLNSHSVVSAWDKQRLIGIGNAISDGALVVYYPHLLIHPHYQSQGIGKEIVGLLKQRCEGFHMHILVAERDAIGFYEKCGFTRAGSTQPMWIYKGKDHSL